MWRVDLLEKDSGAGRDWGQEEKGTTEDELAGWHHWLVGRESEWTPGVGDGQGGLAWWGCKESDTTERLNWTEVSKKWTPLCVCDAPLILKAGSVSRQNAHKWLTRHGPTNLYYVLTGTTTCKVQRQSLPSWSLVQQRDKSTHSYIIVRQMTKGANTPPQAEVQRHENLCGFDSSYWDPISLHILRASNNWRERVGILLPVCFSMLFWNHFV